MKRCYYYEYDNVPKPDLCPCGCCKGYGEHGEAAVCTRNNDSPAWRGIQYNCGWDKPPDRQMMLEEMA